MTTASKPDKPMKAAKLIVDAATKQPLYHLHDWNKSAYALADCSEWPTLSSNLIRQELQWDKVQKLCRLIGLVAERPNESLPLTNVRQLARSLREANK